MLSTYGNSSIGFPSNTYEYVDQLMTSNQSISPSIVTYLDPTKKPISVNTAIDNGSITLAVPCHINTISDGLTRPEKPMLGNSTISRRGRACSGRRKRCEDSAAGFLTLDFGLQKSTRKKARKPRSKAEREETKTIKEIFSCVRCRVLQIKVRETSLVLVRSLILTGRPFSALKTRHARLAQRPLPKSRLDKI